MKVTIPDEWVALWETFDDRFKMISGMEKISRLDVGHLMGLDMEVAPTRNPAWVAWAAIRHNAVTYEDLIRAAWDDKINP